MTITTKILATGLMLVVAIMLSSIINSREIAHLQPSDGIRFTVPLVNTTTYVQSIRVSESPISRIGLYLRRLKDVPNEEAVSIEIREAGKTISQHQIVASRIDNGGITHIEPSSPLVVEPGEFIDVVIAVPTVLSLAVGIETREQDDTFAASHTRFTWNDAPQDNPAAYVLYTPFRPPLALQMAGLLLLTSIFLWLPPAVPWRLPLYIIALAHLISIPAQQYPWLYILTLIISLSGMYMLLRSWQLPRMPALFGAHVFAFTTWFSLHIAGGNDTYAFISLMPWISYAAARFLPRYMTIRPILIFFLPFIFLLLIIAPQPSHTSIAFPKEVFLDPFQSPFIQKQLSNPDGSALPWFHFGSYIGFPALGMAIIGLISALFRRQYRSVLIIFIFSLCLVFVPVTVSFLSSFGMPASHLVIFVTYLLAFFAALGLDSLTRYLGRDMLLTKCIILAIVLISLLDLWHVNAGVITALP